MCVCCAPGLIWIRPSKEALDFPVAAPRQAQAATQLRQSLRELPLVGQNDPEVGVGEGVSRLTGQGTLVAAPGIVGAPEAEEDVAVAVVADVVARVEGQPPGVGRPRVFQPPLGLVDVAHWSAYTLRFPPELNHVSASGHGGDFT